MKMLATMTAISEILQLICFITPEAHFLLVKEYNPEVFAHLTFLYFTGIAEILSIKLYEPAILAAFISFYYTFRHKLPLC